MLSGEHDAAIVQDRVEATIVLRRRMQLAVEEFGGW